MIYLECDLSQVESRIVFMLTGDPELRRLAKLPSDEYDAHTENAKLILGAKETDPDFKRKRHIGKIVSHGAQRDMRGAKLSDKILTELGILIDAAQCDCYLEAYHRSKPAIREGYFREIRRRVMRERRLVNSWGRRWDCRWDRLDDDLYRQAYSFLPQSEAADLMLRCGLIPAYHYMMTAFGRPPNVTVHDSLLCSVPADEAYDLAQVIQRSLSRPLRLAGDELVVPVEWKLGLNWAASEKLGEGFEFKRLPSRHEFTEAARWLEAQRCPR
jgi:DNA polymerase I-like protein with 3'-5' exonuclease and polymerase domains